MQFQQDTSWKRAILRSCSRISNPAELRHRLSVGCQVWRWGGWERFHRSSRQHVQEDGPGPKHISHIWFNTTSKGCPKACGQAGHEACHKGCCHTITAACTQIQHNRCSRDSQSRHNSSHGHGYGNSCNHGLRFNHWSTPRSESCREGEIKGNSEGCACQSQCSSTCCRGITRTAFK